MIDLVYNVALLIALSVVSGFVEHHQKHPHRTAWWQGVVFGVATVIGMLRPLTVEPGIFFDGRSVMISVCGLFFGPVAAAIAGGMAAACRIIQGGAGLYTGLLVILSSVLWGVFFHGRQVRRQTEPTTWQLLWFGLLVQGSVLLLILTLPAGHVAGVLRQTTLPILLTCLPATILIGKLLSNQRSRERALEALAESRDELRTTLYSIGDAIITTDMAGRVAQMNQEAERLTGWREPDARGKGLNEVFRIFNEDTRQAAEDPLRRVLHDGEIVGLANHTLLIARDGSERPISDSGAPIRHANGAITGMVLVFRDQTAERTAQRILHENEEKYRKLFTEMLTGFAIHEIICDSAGRPADYRFLEVNPAFERMTGLRGADLVGRTVLEVLPQTESHWIETYGQVALTGQSTHFENYSQALNRHFEITAYRPQANQFACVFMDITERKQKEAERQKLEDQLRQAQKLESIGRLAGGVAHDFNNKLQVILGSAEILLENLPPEHPFRSDLQEIQQAAQHSAAMTRQLLAFSRQQAISPVAMDLNEAVADSLKMLKRLIGENIRLSFVRRPNREPVFLDPTQLDQLLINLVINARDAIAGTADSGQITLTVASERLLEADCQDRPDFVPPGDYALLSVQDDGPGISPEIVPHIFEPFFTTKVQYKGTGLGLATVYGIIKQNHGAITLQSAPGTGSVFKIYLPRLADPPPVPAGEPAVICKPAGTETVLVVEDEKPLLRMTRKALLDDGYTVLAAASPAAALAVVEQHPGVIHLLLTDIVMPTMNGVVLAEHIRRMRPDIRVLFMSGYPESVIEHRGQMKVEGRLLQKPFTTTALAQQVRAALDEPATAAPPHA